MQINKINALNSYSPNFSQSKENSVQPKTVISKTASAMLLATLLALSCNSKAEVKTDTKTTSDNDRIFLESASNSLAYERNKNYEQAIIEYDKMIKIKPQNAFLYQSRGDLKYKKGDFPGAIRDYAISISKFMHKKDELTKNLASATDEDRKDELKDNIEAYENAINLGHQRIRVLRKIAKTGFDFTSIRDYDIEEVHQGQLRNCYFLATIVNNPALLKKSNCLKWNSDGSAEVSLYPVELDNAQMNFYVTGKRTTYHISNEELNSRLFKFIKKDGKKIPFNLNSSQDMTLKALEIGFLKNLKGDFVSCNKGGNSADAMLMLFGSHIVPDYGRVITGQSNYTREDVKNGIYVVIPAENGKYKSQNDKPVYICGHAFIPQHTYIVNGYDENTDMVSLSNPYFDDRTSEKDDIKIPFAELIKNHFKLDFVIPDKK